MKVFTIQTGVDHEGQTLVWAGANKEEAELKFNEENLEDFGLNDVWLSEWVNGKERVINHKSR